MPAIEAAMYGIIGGLLGELHRWFVIRKELYKGFPPWSKSVAYWVITFLMAISGGVLVYVYSNDGTNFTTLLAFNVGLTAPLLLGKAKDNIPPLEPGTFD